MPKRDLNNIIGIKYNNLTVLSDSGQIGRYRLVRVICDCGTIKNIRLASILSGNTKSCGCRNLIKKEELIGSKYGMLTVLEDKGSVKGKKMVLVQCECGKIKTISLNSINSTSCAKSCGCLIKNSKINLVGLKFERLQIIEDLGTSGGRRWVKIKCDCGNVKDSLLQSLKSGATKSCGCLNKELTSKRSIRHGLWRKHPLYIVWDSMIQRCYNPNNNSYNSYGGRGVHICEEWKVDFTVFYEWAKDKWQKGLQLDKDIITKGNKIYSPTTCCFVTRRKNQRNRRNNIMLEYGGKIQSMADWADEINIGYDTLRYKIKRGYTIEQVIHIEKQIA